MSDENTVATKKLSRFRKNLMDMYGEDATEDDDVIVDTIIEEPPVTEEHGEPVRTRRVRVTGPFERSENHGRWATRDDVVSDLKAVRFRDEGGIGSAGIPLWYEGEEAYMDDSDAHCLIIGSTGSRKTRCCIAPMLKLMARSDESVVITDPKGELLDLTYTDFRSNGYEIKVIDLRRTDCSDRWNPLRVPYDLIKSKVPTKVSKGKAFLRELAADMIPLAKLSDPYWELTAQRGLYALMSALVDTAKRPSQVNMVNLVKLVNDVFASESTMQAFLETYGDAEPECVALRPIITNANGTRNCILSMLYQGLSPFISDESVVDMLSDSSFDMGDLGRRKMALFMILPDENNGLNALASTMVSQLYGSLISVAQSTEGRKVLPVRVNFVLDEFANLPPIPKMADMITASRGRNMRFVLAIQDMFQLTYRYGEEGRTLASNCVNWIFLYSRQMDFLRDLSEMVGRDEDGRLLISPVKLMYLDAGRCEALVVHGRTRPFITSLRDISEYRCIDVTYPQVPRSIKKPVLFDVMKQRRRSSDPGLSDLFP